MKHVFLLIGVLLFVVACGGAQPPTASPAPSPTPMATPTPTPAAQDALSALIADLNAAGVETHQSGSFSAEPLGGLGINLCVAGEPVNAYVYGSADEAAARAGTIDPRDPSHVGNAIVEWAGSPKFWLRQSIIVLYLGTNEPAQSALVSVLGDPFAAGPARPALRGPDC